MMLNEYMIFVNWYTMRGYCHTILISSYASNPWGTEDLKLWNATERIYSHTTLARKCRKTGA